VHGRLLGKTEVKISKRMLWFLRKGEINWKLDTGNMNLET